MANILFVFMLTVLLLFGCQSTDNTEPAMDETLDDSENGINEMETVDQDKLSRILETDYLENVDKLIEYLDKQFDNASSSEMEDLFDEMEGLFGVLLTSILMDMEYLLEEEEKTEETQALMENMTEAISKAQNYMLEKERDYVISLVEIYHKDPNLLSESELERVRDILEKIDDKE